MFTATKGTVILKLLILINIVHLQKEISNILQGLTGKDWKFIFRCGTRILNFPYCIKF